MNLSDFKGIFEIGYQIAKENEELLSNLDSQNGDGDLGITFKKVMNSLVNSLTQSDNDDIGKILIKSGMDVSENAASTMGTLLASGIMGAGSQLKGNTNLDKEGLQLFFDGLVQGIQKRGKANVGEKTILDVLVPIAEHIKTSEEKDLKLLFEQLYDVADKAVENTKQLAAVHGRAARYENQSVGLIDSGSVVAKLLIQAFRDYVRG